MSGGLINKWTDCVSASFHYCAQQMSMINWWTGFRRKGKYKKKKAQKKTPPGEKKRKESLPNQSLSHLKIISTENCAGDACLHKPRNQQSRRQRQARRRQYVVVVWVGMGIAAICHATVWPPFITVTFGAALQRQ